MSVIRKILRGISILATVLVAVAIGIFFYYRAYYMSAINEPFSDSEEAVEVVIMPGDSVITITEKLIEAEVLSDKKMPDGGYVFQWYLSLKKIGSTLKAGNYMLPKNLTMIELVEVLQSAPSQDLWITVKEGTRVEEIAEIVNNVLNAESNTEKSKFDKDEFIAIAKSDVRYQEYEFMAKLPDGKPLEGFLFPDSWLVHRDSSAEEVLKKMLGTFETKIYRRHKTDIENGSYSLYELVSLASIVEREGKNSQDRPMIADVLIRRLQTRGWLLEVDATLQYGLGWSETEQSWWRANLPARKTPNEYNTSVNAGLPPTPICSFGVESFDAVINPESNDYWFYIHDNTGVAHFAKTYAEHVANVKKYLR